MNAPPVMAGGAGSGPTDPNYIDLQSKEKFEANNNKIPQGSTLNRGVTLTTDSLEVPLEAQGIMYDPTQGSRPTLMPLTRVRYVVGSQIEDTSTAFYEALRNRLSPELKNFLEQDEKLPFSQRDPDLIALDQSMHFEADLLAMAQQIAQPTIDNEGATVRAEQYLALPEVVRQNLLTFSTLILTRLENQLQVISPNDPSYDLFLKASNLIKEAGTLLT